MNKKNEKIPDFLGIGAQKSATSWLFSCLKNHPEIYIPPVKEIHYFDRSPDYPSPNTLAIDSPFKRYNFKEIIVRLTSIIRDHFRLNNLNEFTWHLKFNFGYYNNKWYASLFELRNKHQICGEITPAYSILSVDDIKKIHSFNPGLKIIFLLRNPIYRSWSEFLMFLRFNNLKIEDVTESKILSFLRSESTKIRGDYITTLRNWTSVFPRKQIYIGYYDNIKKEPQNMLTDIFKHIGVTDNIDWSLLPINEVIYKGQNIKLPEKYYNILYEMYYHKNILLYNELKNPIINEWINK